MAENKRKPGWWYPYIFVGGFGVVLAVNGALAYFATTTFTGLQTENAYEKGLAYNKTLDQARAQDEMGWTVDVKVEPVAGQAHQSLVVVAYRDRQGRPLDGMAVTARMIRPTSKGHDRDAVLAEVTPGTYGTTVDLPLEGLWDMTLAAAGKEASHQIVRRIVVQ